MTQQLISAGILSLVVSGIFALFELKERKRVLQSRDAQFNRRAGPENPAVTEKWKMYREGTIPTIFLFFFARSLVLFGILTILVWFVR